MYRVSREITVPQQPIHYPMPAYTDLLENYTMRKYQVGPNATLGPKKSYKAMEKKIKGFLVFVLLKTDNPDTSVSVDLYGDGSVEIYLSPRILYEDGLVSPSASSAWVSRYDPENNIYVAFYTPSPWLPWNGFARITIRNDSFETAHYTFLTWILEKNE